VAWGVAKRPGQIFNKRFNRYEGEGWQLVLRFKVFLERLGQIFHTAQWRAEGLSAILREI
jgi:hypothetical protein